MRNVITFGTFDVFHMGHLRILERAKSLGDRLIVGVSSDELNFSKKNRYPVYSQDERLSIVDAIKYVDHVFIEESLEKKEEYILKYDAHVLTMGDDWKGKFDYFESICDVVYFERTPAISTTQIIEVIKDMRV